MLLEGKLSKAADVSVLVPAPTGGGYLCGWENEARGRFALLVIALSYM